MATRKCGWTRVPPLIMGVNAVASWTGVAVIAWPKARLARSMAGHGWSCGSTVMPRTSPGTSTPVSMPMPIFCHVW